mgnify:CR=1 FL=1
MDRLNIRLVNAIPFSKVIWQFIYFIDLYNVNYFNDMRVMIVVNDMVINDESISMIHMYIGFSMRILT